jgi:hypothetical protein
MPFDFGADKRGPQTCTATWSEVWTSAKANCASTTGSAGEKATGEALVDIARSYAVSHSITSYGEKAKPPVFVWLGGFAVTDNFSQISVGLAAVTPPALH